MYHLSWIKFMVPPWANIRRLQIHGDNPHLAKCCDIIQSTIKIGAFPNCCFLDNQYVNFAKYSDIKWVSQPFCVGWNSHEYYVSLFLFVLISGIIKTIQAIKKMTLPMNVRISWFFRLDTIKKMAHEIKSIQPTIWYLIACRLLFSCFSFIDISW